MAIGLSENSRGLGSRQIFVLERRFAIAANQLIGDWLDQREKPNSLRSGGELLCLLNADTSIGCQLGKRIVH